MDNASRVVVNTAAQYTRMVICMCLSLYATRLVLSALGVDDFGIYILIAGIVSLLSFVVNALVITTQRFISYYYGKEKNNTAGLQEIFGTSVFIHFALGLVVVLVIEILGLFLFDGFFNVPDNRIHAAKVIYHLVTCNVFFTFITAPYRALLIAHENIVFISIIDVCDYVLRLLVAFMLLSIGFDKLIFYGACLCAIQFLNLVVFSVYDSIKYEECVLPSKKLINFKYAKEISKFAWWTIYGVGCYTARTQGFSIIFNKFFSLLVNSAFGLAIQIKTSMLLLSNAITNAMNPQIIKEEGLGNRQGMVRKSEMESKLCFLLMSLVIIPCIFEMPSLLAVWLKEVPDHTVFFCRFVLVASLIDQTTIGLDTANRAIGDIRRYTLVVNTTKLFTLVPVVIVLFFNRSLLISMLLYVLFETLSVVVRLVYTHRHIGMSYGDYFNKVLLRLLPPLATSVVCSILVVQLFSFRFRFLLTMFLSASITAWVIYKWGLCDDEKLTVQRVMGKIPVLKRMVNKNVKSDE